MAVQVRVPFSPAVKSSSLLIVIAGAGKSEKEEVCKPNAGGGEGEMGGGEGEGEERGEKLYGSRPIDNRHTIAEGLMYVGITSHNLKNVDCTFYPHRYLVG